MSKNTFGDKVKVSYETFGIGEFYSAYYPKIEVNGKICFIVDKSYKTGYIHAENRYRAKKLGEAYLLKFKGFQMGVTTS